MNITGNNTLTTGSPYIKEAIGVVVARLTFVTALALAGVAGNILVCIVIVSKKLRGRSLMHSYLFNLALADIGVLTTIFPLGVLKERLPHYWPFGKIVCLYFYPIVDTFFGASIWFITAIAFQRYQNIVKNKDLHRPPRSFKHVICEITAIWVISFLFLSFPMFFVVKYTEVNADVIYCEPNWNGTPWPWMGTLHSLSLVILSYLLPLAVISWTYVGIWREIHKSIIFHKNLEKEAGSTSKDNRRTGENTRARKILTPIVVTFAFTMLPLNVFRLLAVFWTPMLVLRYFWTLHNVVVIVTITNSAINPIIYSVVSKDFRKAFMQLIVKGGKPGIQTGTFMLSRSRSDRGTLERHSSYNQGKQKSLQPAVITTQEWPNADKVKETVL